MKQRCQAQVRMRGLAFPRYRQCGNNATVVHKGGHYCKQHDPLVKLQKLEAGRRVDSARREDARIAQEDRQIGQAVRSIFSDDFGTDQILGWVREEKRRRGK